MSTVIVFEVKDGKIVKASSNDDKRINELLDVDEGARYFGEFALGVNPYILHPMEAMTIVASLTEDEDVLAAAVLHDVVEDTGVTEAEIREAFGDRVADLVMAESEDKMRGIPSEASWETRKQATIDHLAGLKRMRC